MPKPRPSNPPKQPPKRLELRGTVTIGAAAVPVAGEPVKQRSFAMVANTGEPMRIWGFESPVVVDLSTIDTSGLPVPALYDHCPDVDYIVGQVQAGRTAGSEFVAEGVFTPPPDGTPPERNYHDKVLGRADNGYVWQVSIGGDPASVETVKAGQSVQVNGRVYAGPVCVARGLTLREISFTVLGADRRTSAVVAGLRGSLMSFEEFVKSKGFNAEKLDETQAANLRQWHAAEYPEDDKMDGAEDAPAEEPKPEEKPAEETPTSAAAKPVAVKGSNSAPPPSPAAELRAEAVAEAKRIKGINALAKEYGSQTKKVNGESVDIAAHAIEKEWSVKDTELELLRASRGSGPNVIVKKDTRESRLAELQAGMILRAGGSLTHKAYKGMGAQALLARNAPWLLRDINDASRDRYMNAGYKFANMSMVDVCREAVQLDGKDVPHDREDMIRAAFSGGGNLTNVFTTSVNAILLSTYVEYGDDTTVGWCSESDVNDFKTNERPRVLVGDGLKKLARGGEAEHTGYSDVAESYKIARYARQFEIDEQDAIDDNFGVFADVPKQMGQSAARLRPDLVYGAVILGNPTLAATALAVFSDSNTPDNLLGSSTLSYASLSTNLAKMRLVRENSVNLNLQATHMLVPPTLEDLALELTTSAGILLGGDDEAVRGDSNSLQKRGLAVVPEPRLENGVVDPSSETSQSGSSSAWYLVCADAHTIEVGYLKGTGRAPRVRTAVLDKGRFGMNWDVSMDIGVKALDFKGMSKSS